MVNRDFGGYDYFCTMFKQIKWQNGQIEYKGYCG